MFSENSGDVFESAHSSRSPSVHSPILASPVLLVAPSVPPSPPAPPQSPDLQRAAPSASSQLPALPPDVISWLVQHDKPRKSSMKVLPGEGTPVANRTRSGRKRLQSSDDLHTLRPNSQSASSIPVVEDDLVIKMRAAFEKRYRNSQKVDSEMEVDMNS
jgi:hypothetical protein